MVEQVELTKPWEAVEQAGGSPELISLEEGEIQGFDHYDKADTFQVDRTVSDASVDDYDALVIPGGVGNPDTMRNDEDAVALRPRVLRVRQADGGRSATRRGCSSRPTSSATAG